jgi:4-hydroxy-tetrahydrodipicolinate synthase
MPELRGVMTAIVTPFDTRGELNLAALPPYIEFQRAAGIDGLVVTGTNGEGTSLSVQERKKYLEAVIEQRGDFTIVAGTGASSITDAIELTRHASAVGADAVLVLPPFFFKNPSAQGVAAYFRQVLDASDIPVLLYSIPHFSAIPVTDEMLSLLTDHPRMAGLKDSAGLWERTHALITGYPNLKIFPGSDELLSRGHAAGAAGSISGTANSFPELVVGVKRAHETGGDAEAAQAKLNAAKSIVMQYPLVANNKSVLAHRGVPRMHVRPPLIDLTAHQETEMMSRLTEAGLL